MTENEIKILDHLHSRYPDPDATNIEISRHLKIDKADFYAAIKRLTDKEYIKETTTINQKEGKLQSWEITLDGAIHFHRLNYQTRIDKLEHRQVRMANRLFWTNFWIAVGAILAGLYYIVQLYAYYKHSLFSSH